MPVNKIFPVVAFVVLTIMQPLPAVAAEVETATKTGTLKAGINTADAMSMGYLGQLVIGLLIVLLCIIALAWFAKRFNRLQSTPDGNLQILGGMSMGARERIVLVQVGSSQLLLGVAPGRVNTLHVLPQSIDTLADQQQVNRRANSLGGGFAEKLASAIGRGKSS